MIVSNATDQGDRPYQEDYHAYYLAPAAMSARGTLLLLADGMGGRAGGSTASFMAVEHFKNAYFLQPREGDAEPGIAEALGRLMPEANAQLLAATKADKNLTGMGTTLIAAVLAGNRLHWASVGDSHLYVLRGGELIALNEDHSIGGQIKQKLATGEITPEQAKGFDGQHHKLVHYLGNRSFSHFDLSREPFELMPDDVVVMCSDGLYGTLSDAEIVEVLQHSRPELCANELVRRVLEKKAPGQDNVTVQVVSGNGDWQPAPEPAAKEGVGPNWRRIGIALLVVALAALLGVGAYLQRSKWRSKRDPAPAAAATQQSTGAGPEAPRSGNAPAAPEKAKASAPAVAPGTAPDAKHGTGAKGADKAQEKGAAATAGK